MNLNKILTENILKEISLKGDDLIDNNTILINNNNQYVLYNYVNQTIIGYGSTVADSNGYTIINNIASEKGFGAILHDIIIMDTFPKEVRSDDELTPASINIWNYYFERRTDVIKSKIPYSLISDTLSEYDEESLTYSYRLRPTTWFNNLKSKSHILINNYKLNTLDILSNGEYFFNEKYGEYFI